MPRTTINLDAPVLRDLKRLQRQERKPLGRLISDLLARALGAAVAAERRPWAWSSRPMRALVDLEDRESVQAVLDRDGPPAVSR